MMNANPLVMCVTNSVAANFTANVLLAIGAKPAMLEDPGEARELAAIADAVLVNVGTVSASQSETMREAIRGARSAGRPWVLDPVAVQLLGFRRGLVREFIDSRPDLVRGNRDEIDFLAPLPVTTLATGVIDVIVAPDGRRLEISGGVGMLQSVTATGCAQGAICAAMLGRGLEPFAAAESSSRLMKRAGELAWERTHLPGAFQLALLDSLYELTH